MEQSVREKDELQQELQLMTEEKEALRSQLEKQQREAATMKVRRVASSSQRAVQEGEPRVQL